MEHQQLIAERVSSVATGTQYAGSGLAIFLSFVNANAAALGLLIALIGVGVNIYFKKRLERIVKDSLNTGWQAPRALEVINEHTD
jgi:hypothetical protein